MIDENLRANGYRRGSLVYLLAKLECMSACTAAFLECALAETLET